MLDTSPLPAMIFAAQGLIKNADSFLELGKESTNVNTAITLLRHALELLEEAGFSENN